MDPHAATHDQLNQTTAAQQDVIGKQGEMIQMLLGAIEKLTHSVVDLGERVKVLEDDRP